MRNLTLSGLGISLLAAIFLATPADPPEARAGVIAHGDANCDGVVNSVDAALGLQLVAGLIAAVPCADAADPDNDGTTTALDVTLILQFDARLLQRLGPIDAPGRIAFVGDDGNVWLASSTGEERQQLTTDGDSDPGGLVAYRNLSWSSDGSRLLFLRAAKVEPTDQDAPPGAASRTSIMIYEANTGELTEIEPQPARDFITYGWKAPQELFVVESRDGFHGCYRDTFDDLTMEVLDLQTESVEEVFTSPDDVFLISPVYMSGANAVVYQAHSYCEGGGLTCRFDLATASTHCLEDISRTILARLDGQRLLVRFIPYSGEMGPLEVFEPSTGNVRGARADERPRFASPSGEYRAVMTEAEGEPGYYVSAGRNHAVAYDGAVLTIERSASGEQVAFLRAELIRIDEQAWAPDDGGLVAQKGQGSAWIVPAAPGTHPYWLAAGREPAWQPAVVGE